MRWKEVEGERVGDGEEVERVGDGEVGVVIGESMEGGRDTRRNRRKNNKARMLLVTSDVGIPKHARKLEPTTFTHTFNVLC